MSQSTQKCVKVKTPIILRKDNLRFNNWKVTTPQTQIIRESTVYESSHGDFLKGEYLSVIIVNRYNVLTNTSQTIAKCESLDGSIVEKTSDNIARLIGQSNYDILFSSLCSVISIELKIRSLLSILTVASKLTDVSVQTSQVYPNFKQSEISTQTEDRMEFFNKKPLRKRSKRQHLAPYVVQDSPTKVKRLIITPKEYQKLQEKDTVEEDSLSADLSEGQVDSDTQLSQSETCVLPDLKGRLDLDETSSDSIGNISVASTTIFNVLQSFDLINVIDERTENIKNIGEKSDITFPVKMLDGVVINLQGKPESLFHMATMDNLKPLSTDHRQKLLRHQAYIDWKYCLLRSSDGNLPIHDAVLNNDLELLKRLCLVLVRVRKLSVDMPNNNNITALQMALRQDSPECLKVLLTAGADPLATDDEHRTPLHVAAEGSSAHVKTILDHCRVEARKILSSDEDLWKDRFENSSDEALGEHLLHLLNTRCNDQGYTPLMLASSIGKHENVQLLLESDPTCVNIKAPNSGDTALYQVVRAVCLDSSDKGNKSAVSYNFEETIKCLLKYGADTSIQNLAGFSSNDLVSDSNNKQLSMIIANCLTVSNTGKLPPGSNVNNYIIVADTPKGKKKMAAKTVEPKKTIVKINNKVSKRINTLTTEIGQELQNTSGKMDSSNTQNLIITKPKGDFIDKYHNFIKSSPDSNIVIIKDEKVISPIKLSNTLKIVDKAIKRKKPDLFESLKKKKADK